ncbi:hypothetical protein K501DRAFT_257197 [Backusella circina FSU 941]|nr:hypothetical protein K501DRAFT_257197 [Backusella circina FSU 941]
MPFRCKCGRTFEKVDTFGTHTSGCASFHFRRASNAVSTNSFWTGFLSSSKSPSTPPVSPIMESPSSPTSSLTGFMLPTALSIQNTFEGVRRKSLYNENTNS